MLTFVWDIDDVLNDLMGAWFTEWRGGHPGCSVGYAGLRENPPHRMLGISKGEYLASLDAFRLSDAARNMMPNAEVLDWLRCYGARHRHMALTARPLASTPGTAEWLFRHFGDYFRSFAVVPSRLPAGLPQYDTVKGDFLEWFGRADVLIDDSEENVAAARKIGIEGVLFPRPWNGNAEEAADTLRRLAALAEAN